MVGRGDLLRLGLFCTGVVLAYWLAVRWCIDRFRKREPVSRFDRRFRSWITGTILLGMAAAGLLCMAYGFLVEPYRLTVTEYRLDTSRLAAGERVRIVHLSDLHVRDRGPREQQLPELVRSLRPDLILYTGDFFAGGPEVEPIVSELLRSWEAPQYACEGNLDDMANLEGTLHGAGVKLLREQRAIEVIRNARVCVYGVALGEWSIARNSMRDLPEDTFNVVLCHRPGSFRSTWNMRADLVLSGHTHGGQVRLPWYGALVTLDSEGKKYEWGRYEHDGTTLIVSRGIGCEPHDPEVRFLCPPEVVVIDVVGTGTPSA